MKTIFFCFLAVLFSLSLTAQKYATTDDGEKVILYENGTWEYDDNDDKNEDKGIPGDCATYIVTDADKMTGESSTSTIREIIVSKDGGNTGLIFSGFFKDGQFSLLFNAYGASLCMEPGSEISILFRDGSKLILQNDHKYNCDNKGAVYFGSRWGKKKELQKMLKKEIETMRVYTTDGYVQEDFSKNNSVDFMETLKCFNELL